MKHDTKEIEEILKNANKEETVTLNDDGIFYTEPTIYRFTKQELTKLLHQQLQKARYDWLRDLEDVMRVDIGDASPTRLAVHALLDRYQAELDQDVSK